MSISLIALGCVLVLVAARKIGRLRVKIWQAMAGGALAVLLTKELCGHRFSAVTISEINKGLD